LPCAVLVIEDEATLARNVKTYLQRNGYDAETAGSAEEGLAAFDRFKPEAVVLDLRLPGMDGLAALARLRALDPNLIVVMLTGHGSVETAVEAMKAGAYDFLTKPVSLS
jgi:DNA-binding NtrC family response regulator